MYECKNVCQRKACLMPSVLQCHILYVICYPNYPNTCDKRHVGRDMRRRHAIIPLMFSYLYGDVNDGIFNPKRHEKNDGYTTSF